MFDGSDGSLVLGNIALTQAGPGSPTVIDVALTGLVPAEGPFDWHVHTLPVTAAGGCEGTGGHYSPTADAGELSNLHGPLPNTTAITETFTNDKLTLYGVDTVLGRSIVLHNKDGALMACATLSGRCADCAARSSTTTAAPTAIPSASPTATPTGSPSASPTATPTQAHVVPGASPPPAPHHGATYLTTSTMVFVTRHLEY